MSSAIPVGRPLIIFIVSVLALLLAAALVGWAAGTASGAGQARPAVADNPFGGGSSGGGGASGSW